MDFNSDSLLKYNYQLYIPNKKIVIQQLLYLHHNNLLTRYFGIKNPLNYIIILIDSMIDKLLSKNILRYIISAKRLKYQNINFIKF